MGQKVNPHGLRVGIIKDWDAKWYAEKDFADAGNVVKVKFEELAAFTGNPEGKITVYDIQGQPIEETTHDQWWPRDEEFEKVMAPYIEKHF